MSDQVVLPESWDLTDQQDIVIGSLIDGAGTYISPNELCSIIYNEDIGTSPAPPKLRVLVQRCRVIIKYLSRDKVKVETKRNSGWKLTVRNGNIMRKIITAME